MDRSPDVPFDVTGASIFASHIAACPLRFVLGDDLTRASAELAFADGAQLVDCLDLLRIPAPLMWVEWNDEIHQKVIRDTGSAADFNAAAPDRRVGVLLRAASDGRRALAAVARDVPLLLAFFLLLSAKDATRSIPISRAAINRKRQAHARGALLDHFEVCASLDAMREPDLRTVELDGRHSPAREAREHV